MAAYEIPGFSFSLPSGTDFRTGAGQFRFINVDTNGKAVAPSANGNAIGVRQNKPNVGEATTIIASGIVMVEASAAVTVGSVVKTGADGRAAIAATTNTVLGTCITAAGGAGELCTVLLNTAHPVAP